jgi:serine/threonine protein kinase
MSDPIQRERLSEPTGAAVVNFNPSTRPFDPSVKPAQAQTGNAIARRYVLGDRLGRGGQAEVYHAFDVALQRAVALKLYYPLRHRAGDNPPAPSHLTPPDTPSDESIDLELDQQTFHALDDLLSGRRHDIWEVAATLGVSRAEVNRSLVRSVSLTGRFSSLRPLAASLGVNPQELLAAAVSQWKRPNPNLLAEIGLERVGQQEGSAEAAPEAPADSSRPRGKALPDIPGVPAEFLQELRFLRELSMPGIISLLDWGCEEGRAFMVLPLCTGDLHSEKKTRGRLPPDEAVRHVRSAALTLQRLHDLGILHCDVKPHNILLRDGEPMLSDFGLARAHSNWEPEGMQGTPEYMSPEQFCVQPLDPRTDIYSLGVTLYELLTGEVPFKGPRSDYDELEALRWRVLFETVPPLSVGAPELPSSLARLCLRAMAKQPEDRFQSAGALAEALGGWNTSGPGGLLHRIGNWFRLKFRPAPAKGADMSKAPPEKPDVSAAIEQNSLSLQASLEAGSREEAGTAHINIAAALSLVSDWEGAVGHYQQALAVYRELADSGAEAATRWALSQTLHSSGSREQALEHARKAAELYVALGSPMAKLISSETASW